MCVLTATTFFAFCLMIPATLQSSGFPDSTHRHCPASFTYFGGCVNGCYKLVLKRMTWDEAVRRCQQLYPGAHLAIVDTPAKQQTVEAIMRPNEGLIAENCYAPSQTGFPSVMIAAQRRDRHSGTSPFVWKLPDGSTRPVYYAYWNEGEPNNVGTSTESCAKIFPRWGYRWNDAPCERVACLVCEVDM